MKISWTTRIIPKSHWIYYEYFQHRYVFTSDKIFPIIPIYVKGRVKNCNFRNWLSIFRKSGITKKNISLLKLTATKWPFSKITRVIFDWFCKKGVELALCWKYPVGHLFLRTFLTVTTATTFWPHCHGDYLAIEVSKLQANSLNIKSGSSSVDSNYTNQNWNFM